MYTNEFNLINVDETVDVPSTFNNRKTAYFKCLPARLAKNSNSNSKFRDMNLKTYNLNSKRQGFANRRDFSKSHEVSYINFLKNQYR